MVEFLMRLLKHVEGSVLWLLENNPQATRNLRRQAQARAVEERRLIFAPHIKLAEHLARHRLADLFLDTLPYGAHTTASDALWAGLPVLTCMGTTFAGRVAASLLHAGGMPELIADTLEDYAASALKLACDAAELAAIRTKLARNRDTFPLFDTARFTRNFEAALVTMRERRQNGGPPVDFAVT
jgi:predicted O-linked N-acetylglucosamine transferase (SPINDLY family)